MADFDKAVEKTLKWEGGKTTDTGGFTNFGISQKAYPGLDIANLTKEGAKAIYRRDYWAPLGLDRINDQASAGALFDYAVNAGVSKARNTAFRVLQDAGIIADKGAGLVDAINRMGAAFASKLTQERIAFYNELAAGNPAKYGKYLSGWLKRAKSFFNDAAGGQAAVSKNLILAAIAAAAVGGYMIYKRK